ncbi:hypothetical protein BDN72DRAFT_769214 [Pluteus cervinus]|uniref:Uncharacterized protein n=1 Tax=Pluteus cervinus TaxID=181527 RepID=A0ACD3AU88_9AGAR|nr:hypothetical protein BDN72DRAFT_769214 [Pluteus cervinus]
MAATLPPIPQDLLSSWSHCRHHKQDTPLTPPMTSTFHHRITPFQPQPRMRMTLPPIAQLDRHISAMPPLTPPEESSPAPPKYSPRLPSLVDSIPAEAERVESDEVFQTKPSKSGEPYLVDWLDFSRSRSAHFIAEKTCEMICYLWFASPPPAEQSYPSPTNSPPFLPRATHTSTLQLVASPTFVSFMQKLLETTQVSQSVIVLSLHYIYRLKDRNRGTPAQPGSEFRIAVAGLMMANKFLDDNTYTNKTWSEVSGIDLAEINKMEREFLMGVDNNLYVDKATYESWLNLLKGLVLAKEKDSQRFRKSRGQVRSTRQKTHTTSTPSSSRIYTSKYRVPSSRARSTSPLRSTRTMPVHTTTSQINPYPYSYPHSHSSNTDNLSPASSEEYSPSPPPQSGCKRTAATAFSPTSASFSHLPSKRPVAISLSIPESTYGASAPNSTSPLEGLQSFAKMSLSTSPLSARPTSHSQHHPHEPSHRAVPNPASSPWSAPGTRDPAPETLVTAYSLDRRTSVPPQNLYFYALACSPIEDEESRSRKARLRYHQPPPPTDAALYYQQERYSQPRQLPPVVQSASTSPHDVHMHVAPPALPHFHETAWTRPPPRSAPLPPVTTGPPPSYHQVEERYYAQESPIPAAPFANAGPPGIHVYPTPMQRSVYPAQHYQHHHYHHAHDWTRGRQF